MASRDDRAADDSADTGLFAVEKHDPYRVEDRLQHSDDGSLQCGNVRNGDRIQDIRQSKLKNTHKEDDTDVHRRDLRTSHKGQHEHKRQQVAPEYIVRRSVLIAFAHENIHRAVAYAGQQCDQISSHSAVRQTVIQEDRQSDQHENDHRDIMACDRLLQHEIAEDCRVDGRRVLQKDRACRGGQLGGQNQQHDQTDIGKDGSDLKKPLRGSRGRRFTISSRSAAISPRIPATANPFQLMNLVHTPEKLQRIEVKTRR